MLPRIEWTALDQFQRIDVLDRPRELRDEVHLDAVRAIIAAVRVGGDEALRDYGTRFDGCTLARLEVGADEFAAAEACVGAEVSAAMRKFILAPGNSTDRTEAYRDFRGRDPDVKALFKVRGFPLPK